VAVKIAVTGATGFVGRHVVDELEQRDLHATLVSRSPLALPTRASRPSIVALDLADPPDDPFDVIGRPDVLIHLAWGGLSNYGSLHHYETELPSHYRFLKTLVVGGLRNLVVTGTCLEYGMLSGALDETIEAQPVSPYGYAKNALRIQLEFLQGLVPFNLTWARLFYLYGSGQASSSLIPQLESAVARGDRVFNMSGGEQLRDYSSVTEVADHIVSLALAAADHGIVNVCSGQPVRVRSLVERRIAEEGWLIEVNRGHHPYPDFEPMEFWGDRQKMDRCLQIPREP
jgi:nucleoside-diphosphate-sugar epimerase